MTSVAMPGNDRGGQRITSQAGSSSYINSGRIQPHHNGEHEKHNRKERKMISYNLLQRQTELDEVNAVSFCSKPEFNDLLESERRNDWINHMLCIVSKALQADNTMKAYRDELIKNILHEDGTFLLEVCWERLESEINKASSLTGVKLAKTLTFYLDIYCSLLRYDDSTTKKMYSKILSLTLLIKERVESVPELNEVSARYNDIRRATDEKRIREREIQEAMAGGRTGVRKGEWIYTDIKPPDDFTKISVHPTKEEVLSTQPVWLRKNRPVGRFEDAHDYLDVQFRLFREDFVCTVRKGIKAVLEKPHIARMGKLRDGEYKIYNNFHIRGTGFTKDGIHHILEVDQNNRVFATRKWLKTKRLPFGSLVCLSIDEFRNHILFATIVNRPSPGPKKHWQKTEDNPNVVHITFLSESNDEFHGMADPVGPYMVVESTAFYESYKHVLSGLQKMAVALQDNLNSFPFDRYIVQCKTVAKLPDYLSSGLHVSLPLPDEAWRSLSYTDPVPVDNTHMWPPASQLEFNESQYAAYKAALTQEFSVIQGPPGTGKTYVGLRIVRTLLHNLYQITKDNNGSRQGFSCFQEKLLARVGANKSQSTSPADPDEENKQQTPEKLDRPILLVCYTNHALDQFLEGILKFCSTDVIRVGSRSRSEQVKGLNLNNLLRNAETAIHKSIYYNLNDQKRDLELEYEELANCTVGKDEGIRGFNHFYPGVIHDVFFKQFSQSVEPSYQYPDYDVVANWVNLTTENMCKAQNRHGRSTAGALKNSCTTSESKEEEFWKYQEDYDPDTHCLEGIDDGDEEGQMPNKEVYTDTHFDGNLIMDEQSVKELVEKCINGKSIMSKKFTNDDRKRLYYYWLTVHQNKVCAQLRQCQDKYAEVLKKQSDLKKQQQVAALKKAKVIGMTTTGAARLQDVLQVVGPRIVIVEEAAEVLEAHIIASLNKHCQHLILIGDHKQLKPSPTVFSLAKDANLDLSLFERMVNNKLPVKTLNVQHRMRPEISKYVRPIYDQLDDHMSVENRPAVKGIAHSVFFLNHKELETEVEGLMSKRNSHEAKMIVELVRYLLVQQYDHKQITIICMYKGQEFFIRDLLSQRKINLSFYQMIKTVCIDDYQGEENDIVIVSLVRSNKEEKVGFVKTQNRICVTLSRAKIGMYVIGNLEMLAKQSDDWKRTVEIAKVAGEYGDTLNLSCLKHSNPALVKKPEDFMKLSPKGGCAQKCDQTLSCGHVCDMDCHPSEHTWICEKICLKHCKNGHRCKDKCHQTCRPCYANLTKELSCGHSYTQRCTDWDIIAPVCKQKFVISLSCGHNYTVECGRQNIIPQCMEKCKRMLEKCHHPCNMMCYEDCRLAMCDVKEEKECSVCGELSMVPCSMPYKCSTPCAETLERCKHKCKGTCFTCRPKDDDVDIKAHIKCTEPCEFLEPCGHSCKRSCYKCFDKGTHGKCREECGKFLECSIHKCKIRCYKCFDSSVTLLHKNKVCLLPCPEVLSCGHKCAGFCGTCKSKGEHAACTKPCKKKHPDCGHSCFGKCSECSSRGSCSPCQAVCGRLMKCGHKCTGKCGDCTQKSGCDPKLCEEPCNLRCTSHDKVCVAKHCKDECRFRHGRQSSVPRCSVGCKHMMCEKYCDESCNIKMCEEQCPLKFKCKLGCGGKLVRCIGMCGDPCPRLCEKCNRADLAKKVKRELKIDVSYGQKWVKLEDCGHIVAVTIMKKSVANPSGLNKVVCCPFPKCKQPVLNTQRYLSANRTDKFKINRKLRSKRKMEEKQQKIAYHNRKRKSADENTISANTIPIIGKVNKRIQRAKEEPDAKISRIAEDDGSASLTSNIQSVAENHDPAQYEEIKGGPVNDAEAVDSVGGCTLSKSAHLEPSFNTGMQINPYDSSKILEGCSTIPVPNEGMVILEEGELADINSDSTSDYAESMEIEVPITQQTAADISHLGKQSEFPLESARGVARGISQLRSKVEMVEFDEMESVYTEKDIIVREMVSSSQKPDKMIDLSMHVEEEVNKSSDEHEQDTIIEKLTYEEKLDQAVQSKLEQEVLAKEADEHQYETITAQLANSQHTANVEDTLWHVVDAVAKDSDAK